MNRVTEKLVDYLRSLPDSLVERMVEHIRVVRCWFVYPSVLSEIHYMNPIENNLPYICRDPSQFAHNGIMRVLKIRNLSGRGFYREGPVVEQRGSSSAGVAQETQKLFAQLRAEAEVGVQRRVEDLDDGTTTPLPRPGGPLRTESIIGLGDEDEDGGLSQWTEDGSAPPASDHERTSDAASDNEEVPAEVGDDREDPSLFAHAAVPPDSVSPTATETERPVSPGGDEKDVLEAAEREVTVDGPLSTATASGSEWMLSESDTDVGEDHITVAQMEDEVADSRDGISAVEEEAVDGDEDETASSEMKVEARAGKDWWPEEAGEDGLGTEEPGGMGEVIESAFETTLDDVVEERDREQPGDDDSGLFGSLFSSIR